MAALGRIQPVGAALQHARLEISRIVTKGLNPDRSRHYFDYVADRQLQSKNVRFFGTFLSGQPWLLAFSSLFFCGCDKVSSDVDVVPATLLCHA